MEKNSFQIVISAIKSVTWFSYDGWWERRGIQTGLEEKDSLMRYYLSRDWLDMKRL